MAAIHIGISAAGSVVGTVVACATYTAMRSTANGSAFVIDQGARLLGLVLGYGTEYVAGSRIGDIVRITTATAGAEVIAPAMRTGGEVGATATAAVAGAGAALLTTGILYGGMYVGRQIYDRLPAIQQRNFLQHPEPMRYDLKNVEGGFDNVIVAGDHISQLHTPENAAAAGGSAAAADLDPLLPFIPKMV
jgi:hypothetical protein